MGKYGMTRGNSRWNDSQRRNGGSNTHSGQLMDPHTRWYMSRVPGVGDFMTALDQERWYNDYFRNTGLTWNDVKYPALLGGQNLVGAAFNSVRTGVGAYVSKNLMSLYR